MKKKRRIILKSSHIIVIATIIVVSLTALTFSSKLSIEPVRSAVSYLIVPFQNGVNYVGTFLAEEFSGFNDVKNLSEKNKKLKKKVNKLKLQISNLQENTAELERLRQLYNLDQEYGEYEKIAAQVIGSTSDNWYDVFTVNRGLADGVKENMNVIGDGGLVGIVTSAGEHDATVRSIIDDNSSVSAMVSTTLNHCVVKGDLTLIADDKIQFDKLQDNENQVEAGARVVTSDISREYLKGILIGYISEAELDSTNLTKKGYITPAVDFQHLSEVLIITTLKQQPEE